MDRTLRILSCKNQFGEKGNRLVYISVPSEMVRVFVFVHVTESVPAHRILKHAEPKHGHPANFDLRVASVSSHISKCAGKA